MAKVEVYGLMVEVLDNHPYYYVCHPREIEEAKLPEDATCDHCVLALMPDDGDIVILWGCGNRMNWSVNRDDPGWEDKMARLWALSDAQRS